MSSGGRVAKGRGPDEDEIAASLGRARAWWDQFVAYATGDEFAGTSGAWKHYSTGWRFVVRDRRRNLVYLSPEAGAWMASYAFGDAATAAAQQARLPPALIRSLVAAKVYPEGRPVRVTVKTAADLAVARQLFAIKFAH